MKQIPLSQGKFALVDDVDYDYLMQWKWCFDGSYAKRRAKSNEEGARFVYMHRVIAKPSEDEVVDHINRDKLDNQRSNLRTLSDQSLNILNQALSKRNKTGARGVVRLPAGRRKPERYVAYISVKDKTKYLGTFLTVDEAEQARIAASMSYHGVHYKN